MGHVYVYALLYALHIVVEFEIVLFMSESTRIQVNKRSLMSDCSVYYVFSLSRMRN